MLKHDRYLSPHYRYYAREMRILAYKQLLESYSSLTLDYMSKAFGVSVGFIDQSVTAHFVSIRLYVTVIVLHCFVAAGWASVRASGL